MRNRRRKWFRQRRFPFRFKKVEDGWESGEPVEHSIDARIYDTFFIVNDGEAIIEKRFITTNEMKTTPVVLLMTIHVPQGQRCRGIATQIISIAQSLAIQNNQPLGIGPIENPVIYSLAQKFGRVKKTMPWSVIVYPK